MSRDDDKTQTHLILAKGTMLSHYRIIKKIGAGGMGATLLPLPRKPFHTFAEGSKIN